MLYQERLIKALFSRGSGQDEDDPKDITHSSHPAHAALNVYTNNYIETGIRALSITYRTVFGIMDEHDFRKLSTAYLRNFPKTCFDWADYGEHLSDFMLGIDAFSSMPFLPELALIDWRLMHIERAKDLSFDAASFSLMQTEDLSHLRFQTAPGLQSMKVLFPVLEIYNLVHGPTSSEANVKQQQRQGSASITSLINDAIKSGHHRSIVLWREEYKGLFEYSSPQANQAFKAILHGDSVAGVLSCFGDDQSSMASWLQDSIASRKIYGLIKK